MESFAWLWLSGGVQGERGVGQAQGASSGGIRMDWGRFGGGV